MREPKKGEPILVWDFNELVAVKRKFIRMRVGCVGVVCVNDRYPDGELGWRNYRLIEEFKDGDLVLVGDGYKCGYEREFALMYKGRYGCLDMDGSSILLWDNCKPRKSETEIATEAKLERIKAIETELEKLKEEITNEN